MGASPYFFRRLMVLDPIHTPPPVETVLLKYPLEAVIPELHRLKVVTLAFLGAGAILRKKRESEAEGPAPVQIHFK